MDVARRRSQLLTENDEYQLLLALLGNRTKRHRQGRFLIQGVAPITRAVRAGWPIEAVLVATGVARSAWAEEVVAHLERAEIVEMPPPLLDRLGERDDGTELIVVGSLPSTDLTRRPIVDDAVWVLGEHLQSPGNLGTLVRSCDAFGAHAAVVTTRSADPFEPKCVRASTGSLFSVPLAVVDSVGRAAEVLRADPPPVRVIGLDEGGTPLDSIDLSGTVAIVAGNETRGLSRRARETCDEIAAIPMRGEASSLNVAVAVSIVLHEIQRRRA